MEKLLRNKTLSDWLMASPLVLVLVFFLVLPIILIVVVSFWRATEFSIIPAFVWENYEFLFGSSVTYAVFLNRLMSIWVNGMRTDELSCHHIVFTSKIKKCHCDKSREFEL